MSIQVNISQPVKNIRALKLALKINSKGILVTHSSQFEVGDEVILKFNSGFKLRGKIFKFSSNSKGQKGMIIEYLMLSPSQKQQLQNLLEQEEHETEHEPSIQKQEPEQAQTHVHMAEKTLITSLNSLEHLALQSPDQKPNFVAYTLDEEAQRASLQTDLAQKTRIEMNLPKMEKVRKKRTWRKVYLALLCSTALFLLIAGVRKKLQLTDDSEKKQLQAIPNVISVGDIQKQTNKSQPESKKPIRRQAPAPSKPKISVEKPLLQSSRPSSARLNQLNYVKTPAFYKISITADQSLKAPNIMRLSNPNRIRFNFKNTEKGNSRALIPINDAMLKHIRTQQVGSSTHIDIELNQRGFPRYDIKVYDRFADIFIYTL